MMNKFMIKAIDEAKQAYKEGNVPIGAIIVKNQQIIASAHNGSGSLEHAEFLVIEKALRKVNKRFLTGCELYSTVEPCLMCSGALINARIDKVFFGTYDSKSGCLGSVTDVFVLPFNHKIEYYGGIMEDECLHILQKFFKEKRETNAR
ncbi:MAG: nucleoside deaminase [Clostridiales bacterium]|nr:nucleoside deaminase [Clostridiales bacterium]